MSTTSRAIGEHGAKLIAATPQRRSRARRSTSSPIATPAGWPASIGARRWRRSTWRMTPASRCMSGWTRRGRATRAPRSPRSSSAPMACRTPSSPTMPAAISCSRARSICASSAPTASPRNGDVANKIGTYLKALAAKDNDVPFYVALPHSTIDWTLADGRDIPIEERCADEVLKMSGRTRTDRWRRSRSPRPAARRAIPVSTSRRRAWSPGFITERGVCAAHRRALRSAVSRSRRGQTPRDAGGEKK